MGNSSPPKMRIGKLGEILVQLRLLEYGIQAAPPILDSGNDLIAIKGEVVKFIQVKTAKRFNKPKKGKIYHIAAWVKFQCADDKALLLDRSKIYLINKDQSTKEKQELTKDLADKIWV